MNRREILKLSAASALTALAPTIAEAAEQRASTPESSVHKYDIFELPLKGPAEGNPYIDIQLQATFTLGHRTMQVDGFYDGDGNYKIRFMPDTEGHWTYTTTSNNPALANKTGAFTCTAAAPNSHGPVVVRAGHHFAYADDSPYFPFGTTCYAWAHQGDALEAQTLDTLASAPFNKIRMCVFPKSYEYNHNEPQFYLFPRTAPISKEHPQGLNDTTRFNPDFFAHFEKLLGRLRDMNIEADLILFHPYDRWGYATLSPEVNDFYLRYVIARFAAYRNVWWSLANEFDLIRSKPTPEFTRLLLYVQQHDPYQHMRSIHYSHVMYDYASPAVTHASLQTYDFASAPTWLAAWKKPIVYDEIQYEGNIFSRWGNLSAEEMTRRFWLGVINGCYVTHGETFIDPKLSAEEAETQKLWWSHGGTLKGASPARIAFLRKVLETTTPLGLEPPENPYYLNAVSRVLPSPTNSVTYTPSDPPAAILYYLDFHQPERVNIVFSPNTTYTAELIDPWNMTITPIPGTFSGRANIKLAVKPYQALRLKRVMNS